MEIIDIELKIESIKKELVDRFISSESLSDSAKLLLITIIEETLSGEYDPVWTSDFYHYCNRTFGWTKEHSKKVLSEVINQHSDTGLDCFADEYNKHTTLIIPTIEYNHGYVNGLYKVISILNSKNQ